LGYALVQSVLFLLVCLNQIEAILPIRKADALPLISELVLTPFGYLPKHCVHHVDESEVVETVGNQVHITNSNGTKKTFPSCSQPAQKRGVQQQPPTGWAAYAYYQVSSGFGSFNGLWSVPPNPSSNVGQTLFLFTVFTNAFDGDPQETIIQPVLQWGPSEAGGGAFWGIASWFVGAGNAFHSDLKPTSAGNAIYGTMTQLSDGRWQINTFDRTSGASVSLTTQVAIKEPYAFVTLEVYGVKDCTNYPPQGIVHFTGLSLNTGPAQWKAVNVDPGFCSELVTVNDPSSVTITF